MGLHRSEDPPLNSWLHAIPNATQIREEAEPLPDLDRQIVVVSHKIHFDVHSTHLSQ